MNKKAQNIGLALAFVLVGTAYGGLIRTVRSQEEAMKERVLKDVDSSLRNDVYRAARAGNCSLIRTEFQKPCANAAAEYWNKFALYPFLHP